MDDNSAILESLLRDPASPVDPRWAMDMLHAYPTFFLPALLLLKRNPEAVDESTRVALQQIVALNCSDPETIADFIDPLGQGWDAFYAAKPQPQIDTDHAINEFINRYGTPSSTEEDALLEKLIFNPVPADYFHVSDTPLDPSDPLLLPPTASDPQEDHPPIKHTSQTHAPMPGIADLEAAEPRPAAEDTLLMESLAKIFIKQRRYKRALEIITKLSLNYPEKSVYFADQIRFLQKLIINQRYIEKNK